jgi:hypothetical protein
MKRTLVRGSLFIAAAALATGGLASSPAGAAAPLQTCKKLTGAVTITPGLTLTPKAQKATATGNLTGCTPAAKTGGSGVMKATLTLPKNSSCIGLAQGKQTLKLASTVTWKNKKTSKLTLTAKTGSGKTATVATITGKVASGLFAGRPVTATIKVTPKKGEKCTNASPVKHLTFVNTKPFVIK